MIIYLGARSSVLRERLRVCSFAGCTAALYLDHWAWAKTCWLCCRCFCILWAALHLGRGAQLNICWCSPESSQLIQIAGFASCWDLPSANWFCGSCQQSLHSLSIGWSARKTYAARRTALRICCLRLKCRTSFILQGESQAKVSWLPGKRSCAVAGIGRRRLSAWWAAGIIMLDLCLLGSRQWT